MELKFRTLRADEIDVRIAQVKESGLQALLYKDARADMTLLDEAVGPMNWQRSHSRDNANCVVSIWDDEKKCWVSKEDTGTESNTEKEKGLASDSFKRACTNWGCGRELYTAPFIWIPAGSCNIRQINNGRYSCYDRFHVSEIGYDDKRNINRLVIVNDRNIVCYSYGVAKAKAQSEASATIADVRTMCGKLGYKPEMVFPSFPNLTPEQIKIGAQKLREAMIKRGIA